MSLKIGSNFKFLYLIILSLTILNSSILPYTSGSTIDQSQSTVRAAVIISNTTIWDSVNIIYNDTLEITTGGNLTIINSYIDFDGMIEQPGFDLNGGTLKIHNSTIRDVEDRGIDGRSSGFLSITNSTFYKFDNDIVRLEGDYHVFINDSLFERSNKDGIQLEFLQEEAVIMNSYFINLDDEGLQIVGSPLYVYNCTFDDIGSDGIRLDDLQTNATLDSLTISNTQDEGIQARGDLDVITISNTHIFDTVEDGIQIDDIEGVAIITNVLIERTGDDGVDVSAPLSHIIILDSIFRNNNESGLETDYAGNVSISTSSFTGNNQHGLDLNNLDNVAIIDTIVSTNKLNGIEATRLIGELQIDGTLIENNFGCGIIFNWSNTISLSDTSVISNLRGGAIILDSSSFTATNIDFQYNNGSGITLVNVKEISIDSSTIKNNIGTGFYSVNASSVILTNISIINSTVLPESSLTLNQIGTAHGVALSKVLLININGSVISDNSGNGIQIDTSSKAVIFASTISNNGIDGIVAQGNTNLIVLNNSILNNQRYGLYYAESATGRVNYNDILDNGDFEFFAENKSVSLDANYNNWGNESLDFVLSSISGPINTTFILNSDGSVKQIIFPEEKEGPNLIHSYIIAGVIALLIIGGLVYWIRLQIGWAKNMKPRLLLLMAKTGIPIISYSLSKEEEKNELLVSGFISAVNSFSSTMLGEKYDIASSLSLQEITHDAFTILLRRIGNWMIVLIVSESNHTTRKEMSKFIKEIKPFLDNLGDEYSYSLSDEDIQNFEEAANRRFSKYLELDNTEKSIKE